MKPKPTKRVKLPTKVRKLARRTQKRRTPKTARRARGPPELYTELPIDEQIEKVLELVAADKLYLNKELMDPKLRKPILTNASHWNKLTAWNADQVLRGGNDRDLTNIIFMLSHPDLGVRTQNAKMWLDHILTHMFSSRMIEGIGESGNYPTIKHRGGKITMRNMTMILLEHRLAVHRWNTRRLQQKQPAKRPTPFQAAEPEPLPLFNQRNVPDDWNAENVTDLMPDPPSSPTITLRPTANVRPEPVPKEYRALD